MRKPSVLLIEDNPDDVALAQRAIARSRAAATLEVARSGREAIGMLRDRADLPKAVFLDINMPEWNGFEVLRRVRADERTRLLPIVMLTTSSEPSDISRSYELGANSYVAKPVDFLEFVEIFGAMTRYWLQLNEVA